MLSHGFLFKFFSIIFIVFSLFFFVLYPVTSSPTHASDKLLPPKDRGLKEIIFLLVVSIIIILGGCETFANAVEHVGNKAGLSHAAAGSLLAAVGTAMPETMIPILALVFGAGGHGEEIGIGAILGAPFMLTTLAFFLLGITVFILRFSGRRERAHLRPDLSAVRFELKYFIFVMILILGISLLRNDKINYIGAVLLVLLYAIYFKITLKHKSQVQEEYSELLYFNRFFKLKKNWTNIIFQVLFGLGCIILGATVFVNNIALLSEAIGVSALVLSLIIAPVATELPEKYNSISWTIRGKDTLAFTNITGAMTFQSMIPVSIGLLFTSWELRSTEIINISFALVSAILVFLTIRRRDSLPALILLVGGILYSIYIFRIFSII
ncbi:MAG TPA: sodium:calcium antiporter [Nitrospinota bacterium]|nr:sodium:calcium antiporter [Nitrospinota bacterium]